MEIMTKAVLKAPTHPREQVKCFGYVSKSDDHQTSSAKELQEGPHSFSPREQNYRTRKQHARWHQRDECFKECNIHSVASVSRCVDGGQNRRRTRTSVLILEPQQLRAQQIRLSIGWRHAPLKACPAWARDPQQIALGRLLVDVPLQHPARPVGLDEAAKLGVDAHR